MQQNAVTVPSNVVTASNKASNQNDTRDSTYNADSIPTDATCKMVEDLINNSSKAINKFTQRYATIKATEETRGTIAKKGEFLLLLKKVRRKYNVSFLEINVYRINSYIRRGILNHNQKGLEPPLSKLE